jgi:hypothetical protein
MQLGGVRTYHWGRLAGRRILVQEEPAHPAKAQPTCEDALAGTRAGEAHLEAGRSRRTLRRSQVRDGLEEAELASPERRGAGAPCEGAGAPLLHSQHIARPILVRQELAHPV